LMMSVFCTSNNTCLNGCHIIALEVNVNPVSDSIYLFSIIFMSFSFNCFTEHGQ